MAKTNTIIPYRLYNSSLSKTDITKFNDLLMEYCYKNVKNIRKNKLYNYKLSNRSVLVNLYKNDNRFTELIDKAYQLLNNVGLYTQKKILLIEMYSYNLDGGVIRSIFGKHYDNEAFRHSNVNTCLFYTQRDEGVKDCNLNYYVKDNTKKGFINKIFPKYIKNTHIIKTGDVLLMSGKLLHQPENCSGTGLRNVIVIFMEAE